MTAILNTISVIATFGFFTGIIFMILDITFGEMECLNYYVCFDLKVKDIAFVVAGIVLILGHAEIYLPW